MNISHVTVMVLFCAFLVMFMQSGFALLTSGFVRSKNALNVMMASFLDYCISSIVFFICGYGFMFGEGCDFIGANQFFLHGLQSPVEGVDPYAFWFFQSSFCGAAATIGLGAMVERLKFATHLLLTAWIAGVVYPICGHWIWGGGWLQKMGFVDFAGSTQVHLIGGVSALIGAIMLGPRFGKYSKHGKTKVIAGHSLVLIIFGAFILWFGWFGFNVGSAMHIGDGSLISKIAVNTHLAACSGAIGALFHVWIKFGKADCSMVVNGALTGLVSITAGCHCFDPEISLLIGALVGWFSTSIVLMLERLKVDDPVGVLVVHGFGGILGTLFVGLFANIPAQDGTTELLGLFYGGGLSLLKVQAIGISAVFLFSGVMIYLAIVVLRALIGFRVSEESEIKGLDLEDHGMESYHDFQIFSH